MSAGYGREQPRDRTREHAPPAVSIIIPTLNEGASLGRTLETTATSVPVEVIVVDGGSQDPTCAIAARAGARVLECRGGRGAQMNAGATCSRAPVLLFLHADTRLPVGWAEEVLDLLSQPSVVAGAFHLGIDSPRLSLRLVEWMANCRSRLLDLPYGDQAIFLTKAVFQQQGGFREIPIMEDFELMQRLRRQGRIALSQASVQTSSRRWVRLGVLGTTLLNQILIAAYCLGADPERLARWYRRGEKEGV